MAERSRKPGLGEIHGGERGVRRRLRRLHELQGVDVGVFELETEADGLAGQGLQVALSFPDNDAIDLVADELLAIGEGVSFKRFSVRRFDLHLNAPGCGSGEVDGEILTREDERLRQQRSSVIAGADGGKAVETHRVAAEAICRLAVVIVDVAGHAILAGLNDIQARVVGSRHPVLIADSGADEALHEGPLVGQSAATGQEDAVGDVGEVTGVDVNGLRLGVGKDSPTGHESRSRADIDVRGAKIGRRLVNVEVFLGGQFAVVEEFHVLDGRPVDVVLARSPGNPAESAPRLLRPGAEVADVTLLGVRPKGNVLGIEGGRLLVVDDRLVLLKLLPVESVFGDERDQPGLPRSAERFEALFLGNARTRIEHGGEVMRVGGAIGEYDVVLFGAEVLVDTQIGLRPVYAVIGNRGAGFFR